MSVSMIGLDTAKSVFQLHGVDAMGKVQLKRKLRRDELIPFFGSSLSGVGSSARAGCARLVDQAAD
jgi:hypothetical protein